MPSEGRIFINYRRSTDLATAGRLHDALTLSFYDGCVFMDIGSIQAGADFWSKLQEHVRGCTIFLLIIGPGWHEATDEHGRRRLDQVNDFVRLEIEHALAHNRHIVPVLIGDTKMPSPMLLPASIRRITSLNAFSLRHEKFASDVNALVDIINDAIPNQTPDLNHSARLNQKRSYAAESAEAQKIEAERPPGWEYLITAELLRSYLKRSLRRWRDLSSGLSTTRAKALDDDESLNWLQEQIQDAALLFGPIQKLFANELLRAWGAPGVPGDAIEILHVCQLIGRAAERIIGWEEHVRSVSVTEKFRRLHAFLPGIAGSQLEKLESVPEFLERVVERARREPDRPHTFEFKVEFELPNDWARKVQRELRQLQSRSTWW